MKDIGNAKIWKHAHLILHLICKLFFFNSLCSLTISLHSLTYLNIIRMCKHMCTAVTQYCNTSQPTYTETHICYTLHSAARLNVKHLQNLSDKYQKGSHNCHSYVLAIMEKVLLQSLCMYVGHSKFLPTYPQTSQ